MDPLDSTLVVSTEISSYLNANPHVTQSSELARAIEALPKTDQMKLETCLNDIVGNMSLNDRKTYVETWNGLRHDESIYEIIYNDNKKSRDTLYTYGALSAAQLVREFTKTGDIHSLTTARWKKDGNFINLNNIKVGPIPSDWGQCWMFRDALISCGAAADEFNLNRDFLTEDHVLKIKGPVYRQPSLAQCLEWVQSRMVLLNGHESLYLDKNPVCTSLSKA